MTRLNREVTRDLLGKIAIVTGGAMGIGEATARKLAVLGASVCILDVNREAGEKTAESIAATGATCEFFLCDVSKTEDVRSAVDAVVARHRGIDIVVSNAGIQDYGDVVSTTEESWDRLMAINLKGCFLVCKYSVPHMLDRAGAAIVIVGSVQSVAALPDSVAYVAAKHALLGLARAMALDYATKGIRVNCVCPGAIDTPMLRWALSRDHHPEQALRACDRVHAMGRIGQPEEVADAIAYLASPQSSFITGVALPVDGGLLVPAGGTNHPDDSTGPRKR